MKEGLLLLFVTKRVLSGSEVYFRVPHGTSGLMGEVWEGTDTRGLR